MISEASPRERIPDAEAIAVFRGRPGVWLTFAGSAFLTLYAERLSPLGLKPNWVVALAIIAERPQISQSALARELRVNRASAMALATTLEERGYVSRHAKSGRNQMALNVSREGLDKLSQACVCEEQLVNETMGWLDPLSLESFIEVLKGVAAKASRRAS